MTGKSIAFLSDADWPGDCFDKSFPIHLLFAIEKANRFHGLGKDGSSDSRSEAGTF